MGADLLRARVALVIDEQQIAVNAGTEAGVEIGDRLFVLRETVIPDPDNPEESLGTAFVRKGTMIVESVQDKFAVARVSRASKSLLAPAEPSFFITENSKAEGRERVYVQAGDPVDIDIAVSDAE